MKAQTTIDMALLRRRLAPLRAAWERQAKRIDALSLRERAILFLSIASVLAALFDTLVLSPQAARAKQRSDAQAQQAAEIAQLREQFVAASRSGNEPAGQLRRQLEAAEAERARLDDALRQASAITVGEGLPAVLQRLLARHPGLVLERLALLPDMPVAMPKDRQQPGGRGRQHQRQQRQHDGRADDLRCQWQRAIQLQLCRRRPGPAAGEQTRGRLAGGVLERQQQRLRRQAGEVRAVGHPLHQLRGRVLRHVGHCQPGHQPRRGVGR